MELKQEYKRVAVYDIILDMELRDDVPLEELPDPKTHADVMIVNGWNVSCPCGCFRKRKLPTCP